ncbi:MAG: hypothetical protein LBI79_03865 [Nitrososphaerota archaeon]|jgi:hypothetical protein|nr:hypothetical protein [Nitrososphaerota archaeon]
MRRSITVTPENDKKILLTKGRFLTGDAPIDIDYTTMVNIFLELGHKVMTAAWTEIANPNVIIDKNDIVETFKKYAFNSDLKEEAVGDQVTEIIFKKLIEQARIAEQQQQLTQKEPAPILPPQQQQQPASDTGKTQKYVS